MPYVRQNTLGLPEIVATLIDAGAKIGSSAVVGVLSRPKAPKYTLDPFAGATGTGVSTEKMVLIGGGVLGGLALLMTMMRR